MIRFKAIQLLTAMAFASLLPVSAHAQDGDSAQLMAMDMRSLEGEIQSRYDAGLAASLDQAWIAANDSRYLWALETKVQCGIALGYLESDTRDETSIRNCQRTYWLMNYRPPPPPPPPPPQRPPICDDEVVGIVFFDFDSAELTAEAGQTLDAIVTNIPVCGWRSLQILGHTDQAGSDAYNLGLSQERADSVQTAFAERGVREDAMTTSAEGESNPRVPLPDGTRSPQNRRVEISAEH